MGSRYAPARLQHFGFSNICGEVGTLVKKLVMMLGFAQCLANTIPSRTASSWRKAKALSRAGESSPEKKFNKEDTDDTLHQPRPHCEFAGSLNISLPTYLPTLILKHPHLRLVKQRDLTRTLARRIRCLDSTCLFLSSQMLRQNSSNSSAAFALSCSRVFDWKRTTQYMQENN